MIYVQGQKIVVIVGPEFDANKSIPKPGHFRSRSQCRIYTRIKQTLIIRSYGPIFWSFGVVGKSDTQPLGLSRA